MQSRVKTTERRKLKFDPAQFHRQLHFLAKCGREFCKLLAGQNFYFTSHRTGKFPIDHILPILPLVCRVTNPFLKSRCLVNV